MIRFAYPNVKANASLFIGCGRYAIFAIGEQPAEGYDVARPDTGSREDIREAALQFAPERSRSTSRVVYEIQDEPEQVYRGESLDLAYLLALINCAKPFRLDVSGNDIWCTGRISFAGEQPLVKSVDQYGFEVKLQAFLSNENHDTLFIVPDTNIDDKIRLLLNERHDINVLFLHDIAVHDLAAQKTIIKIRRNELPELAALLFSSKPHPKPSGRLQNLRDFTVQIRKTGTEDILGTGIAASADGMIITCAGVLEAAFGEHPGQVAEADVDIYFPQLVGDETKVRQAKAAVCLSECRDDIVLLQLRDGQMPLEQDKLAVLGSPVSSHANPFMTYGYTPSAGYVATYAEGTIMGAIEPPFGQTLFTDPVQLKSGPVARELNGAAVLDRNRNLVIGLISSNYSSGHRKKGDKAYAVDVDVLTREPFRSFGLSVQDAPFPKRSVPQPKPQTLEEAAPDPGIAWNNAPAPLRTWVGRTSLLNDFAGDWTDSECRIAGLIGFGGEGKSSLARKVADNLLSLSQKGEREEPRVTHVPFVTHADEQPIFGAKLHGNAAANGDVCCTWENKNQRVDGVFWWGFYTRPGIDEFFEAALTYMSGGRINPAMLPSAGERANVIGAMLGSGRYLFILDGLEALQHQEGDRCGLLENDELRRFLEYFAGSQSFCVITSRVPVLDLLEYAAYTHHDVGQLSPQDRCSLLRTLGVRGDDAALHSVVTDWGGHALTLSLLGSYLVEHFDGDLQHIDEIPPPTAGEACYDRVNRVLNRYDRFLDEAEQAILMIFSVFRTPVGNAAFAGVFRAAAESSALREPVAALNNRAFTVMLNRLAAYRILDYDPAADHYTAHPLIVAHYKALLNTQEPEQVRQVHHDIKEYFLAGAGEMPEIPTLEELAPLMEAVHHACRAGEYDAGYRILNTTIQQKERFVLSFILGAGNTYFLMTQQFFPDHDSTREPLVSTPVEKGNLLHETGFSMMMMGHLRRAIPCYERALNIFSDIEDWRHASCNCMNLTEIYSYFGQVEDGTRINAKSLTLARRAGYPQHEIIALVDRAWLAHLTGDIDVANQYFRQAEELQQTVEPQVRHLTGLEGVKHAHHLRRADDVVYAQDVIMSNLEICTRNGWSNNISRCYRVLGDLDIEAGQFDDARTHHDKALTIARGISSRSVLIDALLSRGRCFARHQQNASSAFNDLNEALEYAVKNGYRIYEADIRIALGWAYCAQAVNSNLSPAKKNSASAGAWRQADRAQRISQKTGYYWGNIDAEELMQALE